MTTKSDAAIQQAVVRELGWDTRVSPTEVGVQVASGVVTLAGRVDSWAKRRAAEEAAHRVAGVLDVANDLEVRLPGSTEKTDAEIAGSVRHALEWDTMVPDKDIRSTVSRGVVTLEGQVPFWSQCHDAERAIERLAGVKEVVNRIEVHPTAQVDGGAVRAAIHSALERHAEREAARLDVRVMDGVVEVTGVVHTWREKDAVLGAIRGTDGVRSVTDRLSVRPYA